MKATTNSDQFSEWMANRAPNPAARVREVLPRPLAGGKQTRPAPVRARVEVPLTGQSAPLPAEERCACGRVREEGLAPGPSCLACRLAAFKATGGTLVRHCPGCGVVIEAASVTHCGDCGAELRAPVGAVTPPAVTPAPRFCGECGGPLSTVTGACGACTGQREPIQGTAATAAATMIAARKQERPIMAGIWLEGVMFPTTCRLCAEPIARGERALYTPRIKRNRRFTCVPCTEGSTIVRP